MKWLKRTILFAVLPLIPVCLYLFAALLGGLIPASFKQAETDDRFLEQPIYLVANMLHADIAIPINSLSLEQFSFLREAGVPLENPGLKYLVIGWGSKAFYTSTKDYSDMEAGTVWQAATGDAAVMHVGPAGELSQVADLVPIKISEKGFARLLAFMRKYFKKEDGHPKLIEGASFGYGDVFYESSGHFHLFNPCNVWVSSALQKAGLSSGIWTPTTYSLMLNHYLYN